MKRKACAAKAEFRRARRRNVANGAVMQRLIAVYPPKSGISARCAVRAPRAQERPCCGMEMVDLVGGERPISDLGGGGLERVGWDLAPKSMRLGGKWR